MLFENVNQHKLSKCLLAIFNALFWKILLYFLRQACNEITDYLGDINIYLFVNSKNSQFNSVWCQSLVPDKDRHVLKSVLEFQSLRLRLECVI